MGFEREIPENQISRLRMTFGTLMPSGKDKGLLASQALGGCMTGSRDSNRIGGIGSFKA